MKKLLSLLLCICCALCLPAAAAHADEYELSAQSAILVCADTGDVLYEKNADDKMLIASITKIMTAIIVIENCDLDEQIKIRPEWSAVEGSSMYLKPDEYYTVSELLTGLMLVSGNDAATALACSMCGDEPSFAVKMNEKAKELGMENSSFRNPHGLDDPEHYSTARDMAILTSYCMENEEFRKIVSESCASVKDQTYVNHNRLLREYEGCIGVKTGYTMAAGRTLVSCAERNGMRLVCVTLNAPDDWNDHRYLLDTGFEDYRMAAYSDNNFKVSLDVASATKGTADAVPENDIKLLVKPKDEIDVKLEAPRILFAGGIKGEKVGEIHVFVNGELAASENLVYTDNVKQNNDRRLTIQERFGRWFDSVLRPYYISGEQT